MRVKSRVLIVAAVAAAFFGAGPAFASDESPAQPDVTAPSDHAAVGDGLAEADNPGPGLPEEPEEPTEEPTPGSPDPDEAAPSTPIEEEPNYTG